MDWMDFNRDGEVETLEFAIGMGIMENEEKEAEDDYWDDEGAVEDDFKRNTLLGEIT